MKALRAVAGAILAIGLSVWLAGIGAAAVSAMNVFGTMDDLPVQTGAYAAFEPAEQSRLVAGRIMDGLFHMVDRMAYSGAGLAVIGMLLLWVSRIGWTRLFMLVTALCVAVGVTGCLMYAMLAPDLQSLLSDRFDAAAAGDVKRARQIVRQFDPLHERANRLYQVQLIAVAGAIASFGAGCARQPKQSNHGTRT